MVCSRHGQDVAVKCDVSKKRVLDWSHGCLGTKTLGPYGVLEDNRRA